MVCARQGLESFAHISDCAAFGQARRVRFSPAQGRARYNVLMAAVAMARQQQSISEQMKTLKQSKKCATLLLAETFVRMLFWRD